MLSDDSKTTDTVLTSDSVVALTLKLLASHPLAQAALEGPDPLRARLSLYARACDSSHSPRAWVVLNEAGSTGECVLKASRTPARAYAAKLFTDVAPPRVFANVLASGSEDENGGACAGAVLYERLGAPLAGLRAELAAGGALFPLLARALADALAPTAFATSIWAQQPHSSAIALRAAFASDGILAAAGEKRITAAVKDVTHIEDTLSLGQKAHAALPQLAHRAAAYETIAHGELTTARVLVGLVPIGPDRLADPEAFRPDEYPSESKMSGSSGSGSGDGGGWASTPIRAVSGELRLTGGGGARPAPLGADLGTLLAGLIAAALAAKARSITAGVVAAKGGYAAFSSRATASRWENHAIAIGAAAEELWVRWTNVFRASWDVDDTAAHNAVQRRLGEEEEGSRSLAPIGTDTVVIAHWNESAPVSLVPTQDAFLACVASDALGFAGIALAKDAASPMTSPDFANLSPLERVYAATRARLVAALLIGVGSKWPMARETRNSTGSLNQSFAFVAAAINSASSTSVSGIDFENDLSIADAALSIALTDILVKGETTRHHKQHACCAGEHEEEE